jgi:polar amino acid transport system substrate-binding protein
MGISTPPSQSRLRRSRGALAVLASVAAFTLAACSSGGSSGSTSTAASPTGAASTTSSASAAATNPALDKYRQNGVTIVYISNPPFSGDDGKGNVTGAGPDVMNKILDNLGIKKRTYSLVDFSGEIPALTSGRATLTGNTFNANSTRCQQVAFTNPVAFYHQGALVPKGNPKNLHSYDDVAKDSSVNVATIRGDAVIPWLQDTYKVPSSRILQFDTVQNALTAVNQGRADVYFNAIVQLTLDLKLPNTDKLEVATPFKGPVISGVEQITNASYALPYADSALLNAINAEIAGLEKSGEMSKILVPDGYPADSIAKPTDSGKSVNPSCPWPSDYVDLSKG